MKGRRILLALLAAAALGSSGCAVLVGLDDTDPRWRYPSCEGGPVVGVPAWMCPPPAPWNGEVEQDLAASPDPLAVEAAARF